MNSPEYPDLLFVPPRAWAPGRDGKAVRYIVVHYTAGAERSTSAEDGAAYDQRRTDGTSAHYFCDSNSVVQCVRTTDRANAALHRGNRLGIQYELCGTVQTRAQWLDPASDATLTNAARQMARDCIRYQIPVRRLSVAETRAAWTQFPQGPKGIVGHVDCTMAYPEDGGDHTDPGPQFPWDVLLHRIAEFVAGGVSAESETDMAQIPQADWANLDWVTRSIRDGQSPIQGGPVAGAPMWLVDQIRALVAGQAASAQREQDLATAVAALAAALTTGGGSVDAAAIIARIDQRTADVTGRIAALEAELDSERAALVAALRSVDT